jgi:hypothetical protein
MDENWHEAQSNDSDRDLDENDFSDDWQESEG